MVRLTSVCSFGVLSKVAQKGFGESMTLREREGNGKEREGI